MSPTTVSVDELGVDEADFEVVQHGRLVEVAERCKVIFAHQDVGVSQVRQVLRLGVQFVLKALKMKQESYNRDTVHTLEIQISIQKRLQLIIHDMYLHLQIISGLSVLTFCGHRQHTTNV